MGNSDTPLVSVGMPVYDEAKWIRRAVESWLAQDYPNFEIILADNASTDGTAQICREYAARDPRIRLVENPYNIGPVRNHKLVFEISRGKYFTWAGGHDYVHPAFISKTVDVLDANDAVAMCTLRSEFRDEEDVCWRTTAGGLDSCGMPPHERFKKLVTHVTTGGGTASVFYALYRREILSSVMDFKKKLGSDVILLSQIALLGEIFQLDDILYYRFVPRDRGGKERLQRHVKQIVGDDGFTIDAQLPYTGMLFGYMQVIEASNLPLADRQSMMQTIMEESNRLNAILKAEFKDFLRNGEQELHSLKIFPDLQRYRAAQILDGLNRAKMFGMLSKESDSLLDICGEILGKKPHEKIGLPGKIKQYVAVRVSKIKPFFKRAIRK